MKYIETFQVFTKSIDDKLLELLCFQYGHNNTLPPVLPIELLGSTFDSHTASYVDIQRFYGGLNNLGVGIGNLFSCLSFLSTLDFNNAWLVRNLLLMLCWMKKKLVSRSPAPKGFSSPKAHDHSALVTLVSLACLPKFSPRYSSRASFQSYMRNSSEIWALAKKVLKGSTHLEPTAGIIFKSLSVLRHVFSLFLPSC